MNQKFPQVGLRAVFEIAGFNKGFILYQRGMRDADRIAQRTAQSITQSMRDVPGTIARSWEQLYTALDPKNLGLTPNQINATREAFVDLGRTARVNVDVLNELAQEGVNVADAMNVAGGATEFNLDAWEQLVEAGMSGQQAFDAVTAAITRSRQQMSLWTTVTGAGVFALRSLIKQMRESVEEYTDLAEVTRQVRFQTGLLTKEASSWVNISEAAGVSATTASRGMAQFLSRVSDLRRDLEAGETVTSDFAKALDFLNIEIADDQDNLKSTSQLLTEINTAFQELGSGARSAQTAEDLFGRTGRQLLPILVDQEQSLADLEERFVELGSIMTTLDQANYEELRKANIELQAAIKGVRLEIGREWVPALTEAKKELADLFNFLRKVSATMRAAQDLTDKLASGTLKLAEIGEFYNKQLRFRLGLEDEVARAAEESAQAQSDAAQEIAESQRLIREESQKTLEAFDEIQTKLNQKLEDIDRDAEEKWESILVGRVRQHFDRALQETRRMEDIRAALNARLDAIDRDFARRWDDILVKRQREAIERGIRLNQQYEDLARKTEQSRLDVLRDFANREEKQRRELIRRVRDAEEDARDRREKLERDHQRRLIDIRFDYLDTVQEAARKNDAVAVARAVRQRNRELRDEQRRFVDEQQDLAASLAKKRRDIERDRQERESDQRRELARALQRVEENARRQREEIARQARRERDARLRAQAQELEDFNKAKAEQKEAARKARDEQIEALRLANRRADEDRAIQYRRQREDFDRNRRRQIEEARRWYELERNDLAVHLNITGRQLEQAYQLWINQAASAAAAVARVISSATAGGMGGVQNLGIIGGRGILSMAEGGVVQASSPTMVMMGDAGPETGVFLPGGSSSMNVNHSFGRMGVDFNGLPGGMNTQQVTQIVYQVMTQVAKGIRVPRN